VPQKLNQQETPHIVLASATSTCPLCENKLRVRKTISRKLKGKIRGLQGDVKGAQLAPTPTANCTSQMINSEKKLKRKIGEEQSRRRI
jgi:hypothetical protein